MTHVIEIERLERNSTKYASTYMSEIYNFAVPLNLTVYKPGFSHKEETPRRSLDFDITFKDPDLKWTGISLSRAAAANLYILLGEALRTYPEE